MRTDRRHRRYCDTSVVDAPANEPPGLRVSCGGATRFDDGTTRHHTLLHDRESFEERVVARYAVKAGGRRAGRSASSRITAASNSGSHKLYKFRVPFSKCSAAAAILPHLSLVLEGLLIKKYSVIQIKIYMSKILIQNWL